MEMYTVADALCEVEVVAITVWVPMLAGGVYRPVVVIVPTVEDPPLMPSTDQETVPLAFVVVNCWVMV